MSSHLAYNTTRLQIPRQVVSCNSVDLQTEVRWTMFVLRDSEVRQLVTIEDGFAACEESYRYYGETRNVLSEPAAAYLLLQKNPPVKCRYKAAHMSNLGVAGARLATPGHYYCWVIDIKTGEPIGLVNETWLARRRTATTAAIVSKWLARPDSKIATLFGAGKIGDEIYATLTHVFNLDEFRIVARRFENAEAYAKRNEISTTAPIQPFKSSEEAINGADIVITMTTASKPFINTDCLKSGALLCSMGGVPEVHFDVLAEVDTLVIDDLSYALAQGDLHEWIKNGNITEKQVLERIDADIGEIAIGAKPGRRHANELILAMIQGMAVGDLAMAKLALDKAATVGMGEFVKV